MEELSKKELMLMIEQLEEENDIIKENLALLKKDDEYFKKETIDLKEKLDSIVHSRSYKILKKINKIFRGN